MKNPDIDITKWKKGIPILALKNKWRIFLFILQKFITYEEKYDITLIYHIQILMHFLKGKEIHFPYYFLNSLIKMAFNIWRNSINIYSNSINIYRALYHFGLIKILIEAKFKFRNDNQRHFLIKKHFIEL